MRKKRKVFSWHHNPNDNIDILVGTLFTPVRPMITNLRSSNKTKYLQQARMGRRALKNKSAVGQGSVVQAEWSDLKASKNVVDSLLFRLGVRLHHRSLKLHS